MATIRIISEYTNPTFDVVAKASSAEYSGEVNTNATPNANTGELVEVQTQAFENPDISVEDINFTGKDGVLSIPQFLQLVKHKYDGTNPIKLIVSYDANPENHLVSIKDLSTTQIPVVVNDYSISFDATDSKDAKLPIGSVTFKETK